MTIPTTSLIGLGIAIFATAAGAASIVLRLQPSLLVSHTTRSTTIAECKTIATDPTPPLNVRSSPVVASDNIVGSLRNGTQLTVLDENQGWLRINRPFEGWVYKDLTVTSCTSAAPVDRPALADAGTKTLLEATEYYQKGNFDGAIALAKTVPAHSSAYQSAQAAMTQWQQDWQTAEAEFQSAQAALNEGRWQDVLSQVNRFPDNRFWRTKLTPIVKEAIQQQAASRQ